MVNEPQYAQQSNDKLIVNTRKPNQGQQGQVTLDSRTIKK
jgi:hypothetical protein